MKRIVKSTAVLAALATRCGPALAQAPSLAVLEERAFQQAAATADPSVVRIETIGGVDVIGEMVAASGPTTGVVVGAEGWIITSSFNFAAKPSSVFVITPDGTRYPATEIGRDESRRLTLLKIPADGLTPLAPAPRDGFRVGQWAVALGRTYDLHFPNLAVGIISALERMDGRALQTDANTSPVNYGGPLVDIEGRALGIIVPLSPQGDDVTAGIEYYDSGIGFAIPMADIVHVLDRLKAGETLKAGKLGILFKGAGILAGEVKIDRVQKGSPADQAGFQVGDVITAIDGTPVNRAQDLRQRMGPLYGGDQVVLTVRREQQSLDLSVTLTGELAPFSPGFLGLRAESPATEPLSTGAKVDFVIPGTPAASAGIQTGDSMTAVAGEKTSNAAETAAKLNRHAAGETVMLEATRDGIPRAVTVTLDAFPSQLPAELPPRPIPTPGEEIKNLPKTGRFMEATAGDDRRFWAYVPEHYNPAYAYGLVVWLHPEGERREGTTLESWRPLCEERGFILMGPPAGNEGWKGSDLAYVMSAIAKMKENYRIDEARTVLVGEGTGARLAGAIAFRESSAFAGAALIDNVLPESAPAPDSEHPLRMHVSAFADSPQVGRIERSIKAFRDAKHPLMFQRWPGDGANGVTEHDAQELGRWIDLLGCL